MNPRPPGAGALDDSAPTLDGVDPPTLSLRGQRVAPPAAVVRDGRYDIGELIGSGGQADAYRVYDRELRRHI